MVEKMYGSGKGIGRPRKGFGERVGAIPVGTDILVIPSKLPVSQGYSATIVDIRFIQPGNPSVTVLTGKDTLVKLGGGTAVDRIN